MTTKSDELFLIERRDVECLRRISKRLYTENRMTADEMRDAAESLRIVCESVENFPVASPL